MPKNNSATQSKIDAESRTVNAVDEERHEPNVVIPRFEMKLHTAGLKGGSKLFCSRGPPLKTMNPFEPKNKSKSASKNFQPRLSCCAGATRLHLFLSCIRRLSGEQEPKRSFYAHRA
jgi:hypothetical protein